MSHGPYQAILLNQKDNVVCLLQDISAGEQPAVDGASSPALLQDTSLGHKIALTKINHGAPVVKYGAVIGLATKDIEPGEHVHLHNLTGLNHARDKAK
ncbi:MAG: D-galactarate dehydratase [Rhizobiaceae bacterium]|nr:D-galactarate dehydratase [Rhizobiaceae bacterium]